MAKSKLEKITPVPPKVEEVKSDFITIASHQLRTPIAAIRWSLDTLLNNGVGKISDRQREIVAAAYQNNRFLAKAVNDLLRASRIEAKSFNLVLEKVDLSEMISSIIKRCQSFAKAYNCLVSFTPAKNLPPVYTDPLQIKPLIEGLVDNAIRYTKPQGQAGKIIIDLKPEGNYLVLAIADSGIGIPAQQQRQVFSRFFRGENAMKSQTEGLGLDLYIAKKIIEQSGGKINFSSVENKGTTFYLYLPLKPPAKKTPAAAAKPPTAEKGVASELEKILQNEREFVAITVHELKAPLGMTKWSLETLQKGTVGKLNSEQLELISQVYRGNERLLVLVRDLLDLAKLQEGKFDIAPQAIDLKTIVDDAVTAFRAQAEKKKIKLQLPSLRGRWPQVIGDAIRVSQVITNLVSNAIKYTPDSGQVIIEAKVVSAPELKKINQQTTTADIVHSHNKKGYFILSVQDTGIGISQADQKKLFTRFFRSRNVMKAKEGTGLGLYITKTIVDLHQGDIWFTSQLGKGSTFYFSLPIA